MSYYLIARAHFISFGRIIIKRLPAFNGFTFSFAQLSRVRFSIFIRAGCSDIFFFSMLCLSVHIFIILELRRIKKIVSDDGLGQKHD